MNLFSFTNPLLFICIILSSFWYIGSALTAILLIITVATVSYKIFSRGSWFNYSMTIVMLIYLAWLYIVTLSSAIPNTSMMTLPVLAGLPIMYLVISNTSDFSKTWEILRVTLFSVAVALALWAIWQVVNNVGYGHAVGPLVDRNAFAALMNLLWFPTAYLYLTQKFTSNRVISLIIASGLFIISIALFATTSRGGIATWLLLLPIMLWAGYRHSKSKQLVVTILIIAVLAYLVSTYALHTTIADRTFQIAQDPSANIRLLIWKSTMEMAMANPFNGTGWGTFSSYYPAYRLPIENSSSGFFAHNDYLQLAAEGGFPALFLQLGVLVGILLLLKRSLKRVSENEGLESVGLLLGVLALFIHAGINFIFNFAFMNVLAGIYLARVSQNTHKAHTLMIPSFSSIRPAVKRLLASFIILMFSLPFLIHLIAQACLAGTQPGLKLINIFIPKLSDYTVANVITTIRPKEGIAQEFMLQTAEHYLTDNISFNKLDSNFQKQLLTETIQRFELVRSQTANNPNLGVREVKVLLAHKDILGNDVANKKAHQILSNSLSIDPYHANSMIMLSRVQVSEGYRDNALSMLKSAKQHVLSSRDQQLISVEGLRQLAAPKIITELDEIEKKLRLVRSDSETGKPLILPPHFTEDIDRRLNQIEAQITQKQ